MTTVNPPELLQWIAFCKKTGILALTRNGFTSSVFFKNGEVISFDTTDPANGWERLLTGKLTDDQMKATLTFRQKAAIGLPQAILAQGFLGESDLQELLKEHAKETIYDFCLWHDGDFHFNENGLDEKELVRIRLDVHPLLLEGARRSDEWKRIREAFPHEGLRLRLNESDRLSDSEKSAFEQRLQGLSPFQLVVLQLVDEGRPLGEIVKALPAGEFQVYFELFQMFQEGLIVIQDKAAEVQSQEQATAPEERPSEMAPSGPSALEWMDLRLWREMQNDLAEITGLTIATFDHPQHPVVDISNNHRICQLSQESAQGRKLCDFYCGKNLRKSFQTDDTLSYQCHNKLQCVILPLEVGDRRASILVGRSFLSPTDVAEFAKTDEMFHLEPRQLDQYAREAKGRSYKSLMGAGKVVKSFLQALGDQSEREKESKRRHYQLSTLLKVSSDFTSSASSREIQELLLITLGVLFEVNSGSLMLWEEDRREFVSRAAHGEFRDWIKGLTYSAHHPLVEQVQKAQAPRRFDIRSELSRAGFDSRISSLCLFPLFHGGQLEGLVNLFNVRLTDEEMEYIASFCGPLAWCLLGRSEPAPAPVPAAAPVAAAAPPTAASRQHLSLLNEFVQDISSVLDSEQLYDAILEKTAQIMRAERGSLMIYEREANALYVKAIKGLNKKLVEQLEIRPGEGVSGHVFKTRAPLLVKNIEKDERIAIRDRFQYNTKSFLSYPLLVRKECIGVLNLTDKPSGELFTEADLETLQGLGNYIAIVLERYKFHQESRSLRVESFTDHLTNLLNRRYFQQRLAEEIERAKRLRRELSLLMLDIDDFKYYNDTNGHLAGDEALKTTAKCIRESVRTVDVVARFGGEEFAVILPETDGQGAQLVAERIRAQVEKTHYFNQEAQPNQQFTISVGAATCPRDAATLAELIDCADKALYEAKFSGKNKVMVHNR